MNRDKHTLISDVFNYLNTQYARRSSSTTQDVNTAPLACNRVKVTFKDEPGEGTGVVRSFYSALADAITDMTYLPREGEVPPSSYDGSSSQSASRTVYQGQITQVNENTIEYTSQRRTVSGSGYGSSYQSGGLSAAAGSSSTDRGVRTRAQQRAAAQLPPTPQSTSAQSSPRKAERRSGNFGRSNSV